MQREVDAEIYARPMAMPLAPGRVPEPVRPLIPLAERWGIGDDGYRDEAVEAASPTELDELLDALAGPAGDAMYDWLAGPAAEATVTEEYVAFSAMAMAGDLARVIQKRRRRAGDPGRPTT
jgi:hypothetical protein